MFLESLRNDNRWLRSAGELSPKGVIWTGPLVWKDHSKLSWCWPMTFGLILFEAKSQSRDELSDLSSSSSIELSQRFEHFFLRLKNLENLHYDIIFVDFGKNGQRLDWHCTSIVLYMNLVHILYHIYEAKGSRDETLISTTIGA
jgi:hypothetical protein